MNDDVLRTSLLDLLHAVGDVSGSILLAGGYGLYLKQLHLQGTATRTLLRADLWPTPRATEDLDMLLFPEVVADGPSMTAVRAALDRLGYTPVKRSEYLQFVRAIATTQEVKIDLLTAQRDVLKQFPTIRADARRARPNVRDHPHLHAHPTDGAVDVGKSPLMIEIVGTRSNGQLVRDHVGIPHPFTYLLMKLTAYRDRRDDEAKDWGRYHALDVFRIVAMMTEAEFDEVRRDVKHFAKNPQVRSCAELVASDFALDTSRGVLAMREYPYWHNDAQVSTFIEALNDLML